MGLGDLFKPKWKHSNSIIRSDAVKELTDEKILIEVAKNDSNHHIRCEAVENPNLKDESVLIEIAENDKNEFVRYSAIDKISNQEVLAKIASTTGYKNYEHCGLHAIENPNLNDDKLLSEIIRNTENRFVYSEAPSKISDKNILIELYDEFKNENGIFNTQRSKRVHIVREITDKNILMDIAKNDKDEDVRKNAVSTLRDKYPELLISREELENMTDEDELIDIAKNHVDVEMRCLAIEKITDENALTDILRTDENHEVHEAIVKNDNTSQEALCEVANDTNHDKYGFIARTNAIPKIKDDKVLSNVALNEDDAQLIYLAVCNPNLTNKKVLRQIADSNIVWYTRNDYDRDIDYNVSEIAKRRL